MNNTDLFEELNGAEVTTASVRKKQMDPVQSKIKTYDIPEADRRQKGLLQVYAQEEKVPVRVPPSYAKYFGRVMRVSINGVVIAIKCDGRSVDLPATFAAEVNRRVAYVEANELKRQKMAHVKNNFESTPGSLNFFG